MKSPAELEDVQWHTLTHAYGSAEDVPELIRALYQGDEETADEAIHELYGNIHHQGTVYPASAPAVPFLAHAVRHVPGKREDLLMLLATLADHDQGDTESPRRNSAVRSPRSARSSPGSSPGCCPASRTPSAACDGRRCAWSRPWPGCFPPSGARCRPGSRFCTPPTPSRRYGRTRWWS